LYIANRVEAKALGQAFGHDPQELGLDLLGTVGRNDVKVTGPLLAHQWHLALINAVGIDDDLRGRRLPKNFRESYGRNAL
jgi:hypothetical protein